MNKKPDFLKQYFWDVDFNRLDCQNHPRYIIERILEHGDIKAVRWMLKTYSREQVVTALKMSRELTPKSANFWALMLDVKEEYIKCLNKSFRAIRKQFWPY